METGIIVICFQLNTNKSTTKFYKIQFLYFSYFKFELQQSSSTVSAGVEEQKSGIKSTPIANTLSMNYCIYRCRNILYRKNITLITN